MQTENLTAQYLLTPHDSVQAGYVGTQGRHLDNLGYNNANTQILPPGTNSQLYIPYPSFARNATYETTNAVSSLASAVRRRAGGGKGGGAAAAAAARGGRRA